MRSHFRPTEIVLPIHPSDPMIETDHLGNDLKQMIEDCNFLIGHVQHDAAENESLAKESPDWGCVECTGAEHFANHAGQIGWRVYVSGLNTSPRLRAHLRSKLLNKGWDNAEVLSA
jgi:hypothetical protein